MERWARSEPHRAWWKAFLKDSGGTGFWHETYLMRGGMEAVHDDVTRPVGLGVFAPLGAARGVQFSSRGRAQVAGEVPAQPAEVSEAELYTPAKR